MRRAMNQQGLSLDFEALTEPAELFFRERALSFSVFALSLTADLALAEGTQGVSWRVFGIRHDTSPQTRQIDDTDRWGPGTRVPESFLPTTTPRQGVVWWSEPISRREKAQVTCSWVLPAPVHQQRASAARRQSSNPSPQEIR